MIKNKGKLSIIILSVACVLSLTVTIVLATFTANKTGSVTLTFENGLTMVLDPQNSGGGSYYYKITRADETATTFSYPQVETPDATVNNRLPTIDGVIATLNKPGYVSLQFAVSEVINGEPQLFDGRWRWQNPMYIYTPYGDRNDWRFEITMNEQSLFTFSNNKSALIGIGNILWSDNDLTHSLYASVRLAGESSRYYFNDLAGRTFRYDITIMARTDQAPTFS